jgi:hypothetical protein
MSTHSYTRLWTHLIWETLNREPMLDKRAAAQASAFLTEYSMLSGMVWNGALRKTIEMVAGQCRGR